MLWFFRNDWVCSVWCVVFYFQDEFYQNGQVSFSFAFRKLGDDKSFIIPSFFIQFSIISRLYKFDYELAFNKISSKEVSGNQLTRISFDGLFTSKMELYGEWCWNFHFFRLSAQISCSFPRALIRNTIFIFEIKFC